MTSLNTIGPEQQHLEGRSVRDIAEYSPEQVNEVWCRKIFRRILQSLELQYAMQMPRRAITPDTIVFHQNGEPLLIPLDVGPPEVREAEDLNALARTIHYAITQELAPAGPLAGRVQGYSDSFLAAIDRCMDPDPAQRPHTIAALRDLLGIVPLKPVAAADAPHFDALADEQGAWPDTIGAPEVPHEAAPVLTPDSVQDIAPAIAPDIAPVPDNAPVPDSAPVSAPINAPAAPLPSATPDLPAFAQTAERPRPRLTLTRRQRWALGAGAAALVALAVAVFAQMGDSGPFDHIVLTLPQQGDGPRAVPDAASVPPASAPPAGDNGANPASGAAGSTATGMTGSAAGNVAQEPTAAPQDALPPGVLTDDAPAPVAGAAEPAEPAAASRLPGVVVTPGGNVYKLHIQPWGVVYVDGIDRGVSPPVKRVVLAPGRHTIRVANPNFHDRVIEVDTASGDGQISINFNDQPR
jgi:hypothetical protein